MASIKISDYTRLHKLTILPANGRLKAVQTINIYEYNGETP